MKVDRIIVAVAIVFAAVYFYETEQIELLAFGDPIGPRLFPYIVGTLFVIGAAVLAFETLRPMVEDAQAEGAAAPSFAERRTTRRVYWMIAAVSAWLLLYAIAFDRIGYVLCSVIFLAGLTFYFHPRKWFVNSAISILLPVVTYVVFHNFLNVSLPAGILPL
jgi:putative tricarboxylic transport membrane protein